MWSAVMASDRAGAAVVGDGDLPADCAITTLIRERQRAPERADERLRESESDFESLRFLRERQRERRDELERAREREIDFERLRFL